MDRMTIVEDQVYEVTKEIAKRLRASTTIVLRAFDKILREVDSATRNILGCAMLADKIEGKVEEATKLLWSYREDYSVIEIVVKSFFFQRNEVCDIEKVADELKRVKQINDTTFENALDFIGGRVTLAGMIADANPAELDDNIKTLQKWNECFWEWKGE